MALVSFNYILFSWLPHFEYVLIYKDCFHFNYHDLVDWKHDTSRKKKLILYSKNNKKGSQNPNYLMNLKFRANAAILKRNFFESISINIMVTYFEFQYKIFCGIPFFVE